MLGLEDVRWVDLNLLSFIGYGLVLGRDFLVTKKESIMLSFLESYILVGLSNSLGISLILISVFGAGA